MNKFFTFAAGVCVGSWVCILATILGGNSPADVYRRAYTDMHEGKIEQIVQKKYPDLWIRYNVKGETHADQ